MKTPIMFCIVKFAKIINAVRSFIILIFYFKEILYSYKKETNKNLVI